MPLKVMKSFTETDQRVKNNKNFGVISMVPLKEI